MKKIIDVNKAVEKMLKGKIVKLAHDVGVFFYYNETKKSFYKMNYNPDLEIVLTPVTKYLNDKDEISGFIEKYSNCTFMVYSFKKMINEFNTPIRLSLREKNKNDIYPEKINYFYDQMYEHKKCIFTPPFLHFYDKRYDKIFCACKESDLDMEIDRFKIIEIGSGEKGQAMPGSITDNFSKESKITSFYDYFNSMIIRVGSYYNRKYFIDLCDNAYLNDSKSCEHVTITRAIELVLQGKIAKLQHSEYLVIMIYHKMTNTIYIIENGANKGEFIPEVLFTPQEMDNKDFSFITESDNFIFKKKEIFSIYDSIEDMIS